jgi:hypothetical protein
VKFAHAIVGLCEGCGAMAPTQRDVAIMPDSSEVANVVPPKGWTVGSVEPGVRIVGAEKPFVPFGNPVDVATHYGKAHQVLLCPQCTAVHSHDQRARVQ